MISSYAFEGIKYKIGDILECIHDEGTEHGPKGHKLEIATFKKEDSCHIWCHGVSGVSSHDDLNRLRREWPTGNFGIMPKKTAYYRNISQEWDI